MAEFGGSDATRLSISSNDRSLNDVIATRSLNGWVSFRNSPHQHFSMGDAPITTTMSVVPGSASRIFLTTTAWSVETATTASFAVNDENGILRCSTPVSNMGVEGN